MKIRPTPQNTFSNALRLLRPEITHKLFGDKGLKPSARVITKFGRLDDDDQRKGPARRFLNLDLLPPGTPLGPWYYQLSEDFQVQVVRFTHTSILYHTSVSFPQWIQLSHHRCWIDTSQKGMPGRATVSSKTVSRKVLPRVLKKPPSRNARSKACENAC